MAYKFNPLPKIFDRVDTGSGSTGIQTITLDSGSISGASVSLVGGLTGLTTTATSSTTAQLDGVLNVEFGGTGTSTLTGVIIGNGTAAFTSSTLSQYSTLCGGVSNQITNVSPGTAGYIYTSNGGSSYPSFQSPSSLGILKWTVTNSTSFNAAANTGYILTANALVTIALPVGAADGSTVGIVAAGTTSWKLTQSASQQCFLLEFSSTTGTGGYLASTGTGQGVQLVSFNSGNSWQAYSWIGGVGFN